MDKISIFELVEKICLENDKKQLIKPINVALVLDVSGSTGQIMYNKKSVLTKEVEIMTEYILANKQNNYELYSFDSTANYHGKVNFLADEDFVDFPYFKPGTLTYTCEALKLINNNINKFKPDKVIIFTDGQTNNNKCNFDPIVQKFKSIGIKIDIVAVSGTNTNMEIITTNEESKIPGMDIVNMLGNNINSLTIYNLFHKNIPFNGLTNSSIDKNSIYFMGTKINGLLINFISDLLLELEKSKSNIDLGVNSNDLKKLLSELGKLLSLLFIQFPQSHPLIDKICSTVKYIIPDSNNLTIIDDNRIMKIIEYGFNCSKQDVPIIMTNFEYHLKESTTKHNEFADAVNLLKTKGTGLSKSRKITIPYGNNQLCLIDSDVVELIKPLDEFPNSIDKFGNVYIGIDGNEQAIRIGMRKFCELIGFPNARMSPSVIFYVLNLMSMMYLSGVELNDNEHMKELRKIAKIQTSMEVMVQKNKYDGKGCWAHWKEGKLIPIHYSNTNTHTTLYTDKLINPLDLTEQIWWCLMMTMLGLFEEQKLYYLKTLEKMGIGSTEQDFLNWFKNSYSHILKGNVVLDKVSEEHKSIYTLDYFEDTDEIFELGQHGSCKVKTWYSKEEIETYVMKQGCVWCKYIPLSTDLIKVEKTKWDLQIKKSLSKGIPFTFSIDTIFNSFTSMSLIDEKLKYRINLIGITGSGKSTTANKMIKLIEEKGGSVLVISADKWSKQGYKGKDIQNKIYDEIMKFESIVNKLKVIIMDLCNENGVINYSFGFNFHKYIDLTFYPNLDKNNFDEYEYWCLNNVLSRPLHNKNTNYWLNPISAGVETCIKVHNTKAKGVAKLLKIYKTNNFNEKLNMQQILNLIKPKANNYKSYLATCDLDKEIKNFIDENIKL